MLQSALSMNTHTTGDHLLATAALLSDEALTSRLADLARSSRATTVELLAHLAELDRRKLHRGLGCGKLFGYCTEILKFSEAAAWNRIVAARAARQFPVILEMLADGRLNLTTIRVLSPHLTSENHCAVLAEACGLARRNVEKIAARLDPQPDAPSICRKLPSRRDPRVSGESRDPVPPTDVTAAADIGAADAVVVSADEKPFADQPDGSAPPSEGTSTPSEKSPASASKSSSAVRGTVIPLRPSRYKLEVTIGDEEHNDLRWLQDAMRREIPDGDPATIVRRALTALRAEVEKKVFCATARPRPAHPATPGSRNIPADVQRRVWERDGGRCAFVARDGRRCGERSYLEFHHVAPYVIGGEPIAANIALRCAAHNAYEAELVFGPRVDRPSQRVPGLP